MRLISGDKVKMSEEFKNKLRGRCLPDRHVNLVSDGECMACSTLHIKEFGECIGIVVGLMDYNNVSSSHPDYNPAKLGPEIEVRWQPANLKYAYHPDDLEKV